MKFKNIVCLTKANRNHTQTDRNENQIVFNESIIEIVDDTIMDINLCGREVLFVGSNEQIDKETVIVKWVKFFEDGTYTYTVPSDTTDILVMTKSIYDELKIRGLSPENIYQMFREKGLGKMSVEVSKVSDFCALTARITE